MVKDSSKKLKDSKEAEKVDEVIVKKVEEPKKDVTSDTTIQKEEPKKITKKAPSKMPEGDIPKPKKAKKSTKKLIKTGKESESSALADESEKVASGKSMGLIFGVTIAVAIIAGVSYYAYTKFFKKNKKEIKEIPVENIKSISEVKKVE